MITIKDYVRVKSLEEAWDEYEDIQRYVLYTEEELAEIAAAEEEELESNWINEDIDFDEYDEYYDYD